MLDLLLTHAGILPLRAAVTDEGSPHRRLAKWCRDLTADLEVKAVPLGDVLETMIDLLLTDRHTSDAARRQLAHKVRPRRR